MSDSTPPPGKAPPRTVDDTPPPTSLGPMRQVKSKIERRVFWACIWGLLALGLIAWSLVHPKPLPVIVAMSVGQLIGTLSFLLFLGSIFLDFRANYRLTKRGARVPPPTPSNPGGE